MRKNDALKSLEKRKGKKNTFLKLFERIKKTVSKNQTLVDY